MASRTWSELPPAPGPPRSGAAICISKSRLFRFGGFDGAALHAVAVGRGGREYLALAMGQRGPGAPLDDVWTFQVPPLGMTPASLTDAVLQAVGRKTGEGRWTRVAARPRDANDADEQAMPPPRAWLASAPMGHVDEAALVLWGGLGADHQHMGDGWILRLGE